MHFGLMTATFFLMASPQGQGQASPFSLLTPFIVVFFIMWLLVIRPQRKEQKRRQNMLNEIKKGDQIITNGGMIGKVTKVKDDQIEVKVDENKDVKITFLRTAVLSVVDKTEKKK